MDTFFGLPSHPLLVHAVTVLFPLAALAGIVIAISPSWREKIGWITVGLAGVGLVFTWLAKESGEALERALEQTEGISAQLERHTQLGDVTLFWMIPMFLVLLGFMLWHRSRKQKGLPELAIKSPVAMGLVALMLVAAATTTYKVIEVGHSGAKAAWGDVKIPAGGGEEGGENEG